VRKGNRKSIFTALLSSPLGVEPEPEPTIQASNLVFSGITNSTLEINFTPGNGEARIVVARAFSSVNINPVDGVTYTADPEFGVGTEIGVGNFVVYNGTGSSFTFEHAGGIAEYYFKVYEYNGEAGAEFYLLEDETLNPNNVVSPGLLTGLMYWYDIPSETPYADGAEIINPVTDWSPSPTNLVSSSTRRLTYHLNQINGLPCARVAAGDHLTSAVKTKFDTLHQGNSTMIFVMKRTADTTSMTLFDNGNGDTASAGRNIQSLDTGRLRDRCFAGGVNAFTASAPDNSQPLDTWHVLMLRYENGIIGNDYVMEVDNVEKVSAETAGAQSGLTSTANPTFFRQANNSGASFLCDIVEWYGFNYALSAQNLSALIGSENEQFGL
jgi:hypothetical protein